MAKKEFKDLLKDLMYKKYGTGASRKLAKAIGADVGSISNYVTGIRRPQLDRLHDIANVFNVPVEYFMDDESKWKGKGNRTSKGGNNKKEIDFKLLIQLCEIQCTKKEILNILDVCSKTLDARIEEEYNISYQEFFEIYSSQGKASLRRTQFKMAQKNPAMAIFLGKNILDQRDRHEVSNVSQEDIDNAIKEELKKLENVNNNNAILVDKISNENDGLNGDGGNDA
jgi:transcriptional regulator with XRE-family HTH domain